jgi:hypothetical protein
MEGIQKDITGIEDDNRSCIGVQDGGTGQNNFLRGYQMTDENGMVQFNTIYPGWYVAEDVHGGHKDRDGIIGQLAEVFSLIKQGNNNNNCIYMA